MQNENTNVDTQDFNKLIEEIKLLRESNARWEQRFATMNENWERCYETIIKFFADQLKDKWIADQEEIIKTMQEEIDMWRKFDADHGALDRLGTTNYQAMLAKCEFVHVTDRILKQRSKQAK